jgi:hypothetical protein
MLKKVIPILIWWIAFLSSCTSDFKEANTNPYEISNKSLEQDFNNVGAYFPTLLGNIFGHQIEENLVAESFCDYVATPTPFTGGVNNTTYYIRWNIYWDRIYGSLMAPASHVIKIADEGGYTVFSAWAKLIQIMGVSRLTTYHGPVIYSDYGSSSSTINYDSEPELYKQFFAELDQIQSIFGANITYTGIKRFDASYDGDIPSWMRFVNSLRLRLAIRISKADPVLAKAQGERAISDGAGLILNNTQNMTISLYGGRLYLSVICFEWDDTRMSAGMESFLVGLKDPRISKYFQPPVDKTLYADHPNFPYKGIRNGAKLMAKDDHTAFSKINESFKSVVRRDYLSASEVYFDLAEAALRGWVGAGDAKSNYENGVRASFEEWGADGVDVYLADNASTPIDYVDPKYDGIVNSFKSRSTVTVMWNETDSKEQKLEKIITQKWIAGFYNPNEPWADFRRTGYPKIPLVYKNDSNADWGIIPAGEWIKRMPFVEAERTGNSGGVAGATAKLGGPDNIATRLWFDTGKPNFH